MLRVRFAEVSRSAMQELGVNLFTGPTGYKDVIARSTTQQFSAPDYSELSRTANLDGDLTGASGKYSLSDFLNLFVFNNKYNIGTVIKALQEKGLFQSLAEPNLIATNGKEASFLAGGEYPYPVVQGGGTQNSVTIMFKEFGIRLNFTPTVLGGDLINLKVRPEVSSLDFAQRRHRVRLPRAGADHPPHRDRSRAARRPDVRDCRPAEQHRAGLDAQDSRASATSRFSAGCSRAAAIQKAQTELVVMITPTIVRRGQTRRLGRAAVARRAVSWPRRRRRIRIPTPTSARPAIR